jgi:hypothetical protein
MDHLPCHQINFLTSSRGLGLPSVVQHATLAFLGCWALIVLALIFLFRARWLPYSSWYNGTCKYQYLSLLGCTTKSPCIVIWDCPMTCLAFWKFNSVILSSNAIFFNGPITWARIYFVFSKCSFEFHANTSSLLWKSSSRGVVINLS